MAPSIPARLSPGAHIRVVAPSASLSIISPANRQAATARLENQGYVVTFGEHVEETGVFKAADPAHRVADIHAAFADPAVDAIMAAIGGFDSSRLLADLDFDLIRSHPKIFVGYSDITALSNGIFARAGLVTYSGPTWSSFAEREGFAYTRDAFLRCLAQEEPFAVTPSELWSNDRWYADQDQRTFMPNDGYSVIQEGAAEGVVIGGNLSTFNLLLGTPYRPSFDGALLFLEEDKLSDAYLVGRMLQAVVDQPDFTGVRGIVFGRFEVASTITQDDVLEMVRSRPKLRHLPVIANADFGHTEPRWTFPIGGTARIAAQGQQASIEFLVH